MRVLIVEDEKGISDGIRTILEKEGYQVDAAFDGLEGQDYIMTGIYDIILLDIMMPYKNGMEVLSEVRKAGISTPVIMLTAKSQTEDRIAGLDCGADDYLAKPFDVGELLARIRARVRNGQYNSNDTIIVGDININRNTYMLSCGDMQIKLANKEFALLEYLMMNANHILTKEMLISKVWGLDGEQEYNNLEVYISFLRKKLKFVRSHTKIATTKGVGYSIGVADD